MRGLYELLAGEPWCWTQREINRHDDLYLWEVVIRPAVRRSRELEGKTGSGRVGHGWEESKRTLPSREQYVMIGERLGVSKEVSEAEYDKFQASKNNGRNFR